jgi:hypothetical protein
VIKDEFPWAARRSSGNRMEIMLDQSSKAIREKREKFGFDFWQLRTPLTGYQIEGTNPWALDNGCFSGDLPQKWFDMLEQAREDRPVFVTLPDVVGSARRTMDLFTHFDRTTNGLPRALVLQDGIGDVEIPWSLIHAVFVGGTDAFKIAPEAFAAARCARMLGKWVHVGRVNNERRVKNWLGIADSIDGTGLSCGRDDQLQRVIDAIRGEEKQMDMLGGI